MLVAEEQSSETVVKNDSCRTRDTSITDGEFMTADRSETHSMNAWPNVVALGTLGVYFAQETAPREHGGTVRRVDVRERSRLKRR